MFKRNKKQIALPHWGDARNWVIKIIDSCTNMRQLNTARRLCHIWSDQYVNKIDYKTHSEIQREMRMKLDNKWEEIFKEMIPEKTV